jgi:hypothetical protein
LAESKAETKKESKVEISPVMIVVALAVVAGAVIFAWLTFGPKPPPPPQPVLTAEARQYLPNLKLSEVLPQTSESYIQKSLFEIMGKITNAGPKAVTGVVVTCVFRDYYGKEVKRELSTVVSARGGPMAPDTTKSFRLAFDDLPDEWNRQMPDLVIAEIRFQ